MAKTIKLAVACDWVKKGQQESYDIEGKTFDLLFNVNQPGLDYALDIGAPFSKVSDLYPPQKRIFATTEPSAHMGYDASLSNRIIAFYKRWILTSHPQLLISPRAVLANCSASRWVRNPPEKKIFGVGGFVSAKKAPGFPGYALRHSLLQRADEIRIPSMVYNHTGEWKGETFSYPVPSKDSAYKYMFCLAIENYPEKGYFTEKLVDCFASRTVPLYFGDPSIGSVFNEGGIIKIGPSDAVGVINSLTEKDYLTRMNAMEENFERSKRYWSIVKSVCYEIGRLER